jgi:uncharacterized OB-fold protein
MSETVRPIPLPNLDSKPYWEACKRHELRVQRCRECQRYRFYPRTCCPHCLSFEADWEKVSGEGVIYSFTVVHRPPSEAFRDAVPYVVALIQLDEGIRMMSNVAGCPADQVRIGMRVRAVFQEITQTITLPQFVTV